MQTFWKRKSLGDLIFDLVIYIGVTFALVITLYPFLYVLSMSLSDPGAVLRREIFLWPVGINLDTYKTVLSDPVLWRGYYNTIWYTVVGTLLNLSFTIMAAYPLSRKRFFARNFFMLMFVFTMFFSGGMIPTFIVVIKAGLYDTRGAILLPVLIATYNLIICRTFFQTIPEELFECARLEGAGEWRIVLRIVLPLSAPVIAVLVLFYGVNHWNSWFSAMIYLPDSDLHPIQLYLRRVLIQASREVADQMEQQGQGEEGMNVFSLMQIKYTVMIVAILPIVVIYPFLQKYFVKGVMIGAIKG